MSLTLSFEAFWTFAMERVQKHNTLTYHKCCDVWTTLKSKAARNSHLSRETWEFILAGLKTASNSEKDKKRALQAKMIEEGMQIPVVVNQYCTHALAEKVDKPGSVAKESPSKSELSHGGSIGHQPYDFLDPHMPAFPPLPSQYAHTSDFYNYNLGFMNPQTFYVPPHGNSNQQGQVQRIEALEVGYSKLNATVELLLSHLQISGMSRGPPKQVHDPYSYGSDPLLNPECLRDVLQRIIDTMTAIAQTVDNLKLNEDCRKCMRIPDASEKKVKETTALMMEALDQNKNLQSINASLYQKLSKAQQENNELRSRVKLQKNTSQSNSQPPQAWKIPPPQ